MVEVFSTNIVSNINAEQVLDILQQHFPGLGINFDLEDCDNILRVQSKLDGEICIKSILRIVRDQGFKIELLPDVVNEEKNGMQKRFWQK
ncbi:hypothetical protein SAMN04487891_11333 [Flagellimonas taeanensis]|jgi:hypothetical protein|uniref:Copper chaperone CopZ n=1 Tax=Flagellimonas taeanensis TaxID=1005926 RepID=A0A1M6UR50_9FLAO|nr:hypothetical protein [Allomuricauda taeanensis]SFC53836.1 hypothetical protein SAMN04487891_11333 [Allomuricauda taeanensis]SHK71641.1 hypothetical protein SAMN05216293_1733 [Allomuricauda taeanensis]